MLPRVSTNATASAGDVAGHSTSDHPTTTLPTRQLGDDDYGRYESGAELAAAVWSVRVRDRHFDLLDRAIAMLVDRSLPLDLDDLLAELAAPSIETLIALDLLGTARRIDELEEVVLADVNEWLTRWGAGEPRPLFVVKSGAIRRRMFLRCTRSPPPQPAAGSCE